MGKARKEIDLMLEDFSFIAKALIPLTTEEILFLEQNMTENGLKMAEPGWFGFGAKEAHKHNAKLYLISCKIVYKAYFKVTSDNLLEEINTQYKGDINALMEASLYKMYKLNLIDYYQHLFFPFFDFVAGF